MSEDYSRMIILYGSFAVMGAVIYSHYYFDKKNVEKEKKIKEKISKLEAGLDEDLDKLSL